MTVVSEVTAIREKATLLSDRMREARIEIDTVVETLSVEEVDPLTDLLELLPTFAVEPKLTLAPRANVSLGTSILDIVQLSVSALDLILSLSDHLDSRLDEIKESLEEEKLRGDVSRGGLRYILGHKNQAPKDLGNMCQGCRTATMRLTESHILPARSDFCSDECWGIANTAGGTLA